MASGELVHGEAIVDGSAAAGITMLLYPSGSTTARTLASDEYLEIYDLHMVIENGGEATLAADTDAAGRRIVQGSYAANGGVDKKFCVPYACPRGVTPKLFGPASGLNVAIIQGAIRKA